MGVALSQRGLLLQDKIGERLPEFIRQLTEILRDPRFIWVPLPSDYLSAVDKSGNDAPITITTAQPARVSRLGQGIAVTFNATTDAYFTPDQNRYSFNLAGLSDLPFSIVALINATSSAADRQIMSKFNTSDGEYRLYVNATTNKLSLGIRDQSAAVEPNATSNAAITLGSWVSVAATYSGLGGALAANGITLYQAGLAIAAIATQQATYVAMENLLAALEVGSRSNHASTLFLGSMAMVALCGVQLTAAEISDVSNLCKNFFGAA